MIATLSTSLRHACLRLATARGRGFRGIKEDCWRRKGGGGRKRAPGTAIIKPEVAAAVVKPQPVLAGAVKDRRLNPIKLRQMKERRRAIEDEVTRLEVEIADFEAALSNYRTAEESQLMADLLKARRADLDALLMEWEEVAQTIEANS